MLHRFSLSAALLASVSILPTLAHAQTTNDRPAGDSVATVGDIIVTSQKINQRLVDVPITISAATGQRMEELGVSDLDELSNYVPGLNVQEQSANNPGIVIRGITSDSGSAQQAARVTLYYNGVDISRSRGSYQAIYDMERIEVIKGPQATLFGTASAVGAISMISARPRLGYSGQLTAGVGNYNQQLLSGYVNAGTERLAGRLAFEWKQRDGYVENLAPNQDDLYAQDQLGVRASLRYQPIDALTLDLIGTYDRQRNSGTPFINRRLPTEAGPANPFGKAHLGGSPFSAQALGAEKLGLTRDVYDLNLTAAWDISDHWTMTMVNAYRKFDSLEIFDADGSAAWYLEFAEDARGWQFNHETRFAYSSDRFRGAAGWNVFKEKGDQIVPFSSEEGTFIQCSASVIPGLACIAPGGAVTASAATGILTGGRATVLPYSSIFGNSGDNISYSAFVDGTWLATPKLEITAGVRALKETRRSGYFADVPNTVLTGKPLIPNQVDTRGQTYRIENDFDAILPRFNVLYRFSPDVNVFGTISKGRRSPTVQMGARSTASGPVPNAADIPAENVWNYEVGLKGRASIVSGSLGVYYQTYDNFQVSVVRDGVSVTESAGSAKNLGVEAEVLVQPTQDFTAFANIGYIDGGIDDNASNGRFAGNQFRLQPELQGAVGFTLDGALTEGVRISITPSVTYRSRIFFELPNTPLISQDAVTLVNLRAGLSFRDDRIKVSAYVRNVTNARYLLDAGNTGGAFGYPTFIPAEPRFYGLQVTGRF